MATLHPEQGVRMVLTRGAISDDGATYRVDVYAPDGVRFETSARLGSHGAQIAEFETAPPAWVTTFIERFTLGLARKHAGGTWPRKLTRWRAER